jgi:hypothetical protein
MSFIAAFDLEARHLDGVNAFLNSRLDEDEQIHCHMPDGYKIPGKAWLLLRALYGMTRSPYLWFRELSTTLKDLGFHPILEERCILTNERITIFFYVDDLIIIFDKQYKKEYEVLRDRLQTKYEFRDLGDLSWFLNLRITRDRPKRRLFMTMDAYIDKIIREFDLENAPRVYTPLSLDASKFVPFDGRATPEQIHSYQSRIGHLIYPATALRPDIAYAASLLARFMQNPSPIHSDQANRVIVYLRDHKNLSIVFDGLATDPNASMRVVEAASDAAYGDDPSTRRSSEGYVIKIFGGPVDWRASLQNTVTTSTTEAELLALTHLGKEVIWWQRFFKQMAFDPGHDITIQSDNTQTVGILNKSMPLLTTKLRHVDIHQHWLRERVQTGDLGIEWVPTSDIVADGLTKPLNTVKHAHFVKLLGLTDYTKP